MATTTEALSRVRFRSDRTQRVNESVIREMTRLAMEHKAVNLAQGFPDFPAPEILKNAAREAITGDINQYAITWERNRFAMRSVRSTKEPTVSISIRNARSRCAAVRPKG